MKNIPDISTERNKTSLAGKIAYVKSTHKVMKNIVLQVTFILLSFGLVGEMMGQTNPAAQTLPYTQNFGTSTFTSMPVGMAAWTAGGNRTTQSAAEGASPAADATITAATASQTGGNIYGYAVSSNARAYIQQSSNATNGTNTIAASINTGAGVTSINVSYQLELINGGVTTQDFGLALQYRAGTSGSWTTISGSAITFGAVTTYTTSTLSYTVSGLTASTVYQIRWITWRPTGSGNSKGVGIDNISISASGPTNPTAQNLPYTQNFGTAAFTAYPAGFQGWGGLNGGTITTQAQALASAPPSNATLTSQSGAFSPEPSGGLYGYALASNAQLAIAASNDPTNGLNQPIMAINTGAGITALTVAYDLEILFSGNRTQGIELEYRSGTSGSWTAVASSAVTYSSPTLNSKTSYSFNLTGLTASTVYQFRWASWRDQGSGTTNTTIGLDNISVTGVSLPTVTTPTSSSILTTGATLGATVTSNGGSVLTSRGTVWGTTASPTGNLLAEGGTSVAAFSHTRTGFTPNTVYTYRGYAVNFAGTGYSADANFTTLHNAPTIGSASSITSTSFIASWTAPTGGGSATFTYTIEVDDDNGFNSINFTQSSISSGTLTSSVTGLISGTTYYYRVRAVNAGGASLWSSVSGGVTTLAPAPEINVKQSATNYLTASTYAFASAASGTTNDITFTIENLGTSNLTFSTPVVSGTGFSLQSSPTSPISGPSGTSTFVVRFSPTTPGSYTGSITIANNDADESSYVINLSGTGTPNAVSDIIATSGYSYNSNIDYTAFQIGTISNTSNSISLFQFDIRDGGGAADADALPTILSGITFNVTNLTNIRTAALFNGNALVNAAPTINTGAGTIAFSGLSGANVTAADGGTNSLTLRVSFQSTVTDNAQFQVTIANANVAAAGSNTSSTFSAFTSVVSSTTTDRNRLEVTADRIAFVQQPSSVGVSVNMTPAVTVSANDANSNRDLDYIGNISITSTGTLTGTPVVVACASGLATFSSLSHTVSGTGFTLTATSTGLAVSNTVTSGAFDISSVAAGSYRTTSAGTWPSSGTATWERFVSGSWTSSTPAASTTDILYIRHAITTNAAFSAAGGVGTKMTIESGGTFNGVHNCTFGILQINSGGVLSINDPAVSVLASTGTVTVESGGKVIANSGTFENTDGFWNGIENFKTGSTFEIQNWDWSKSSGFAYRLVASTPQISSNNAGYLFGNLYFNASPSENFGFVAGIPSPSTPLKLAENNLTINCGGSFAAQLVNTDQDVQIGGNVIVEGGTFRFAAVTTSSVDHIINGNITVNSGVAEINPTSMNSNLVSVNVKGNINVLSSGSLSSGDSDSKFVFSPPSISSVQTLSLQSVLGTNVDFEIASGSTVQLINQNLALSNSNNSLSILSGGTLDFNGFDVNGLGDFIQNSGARLKITSANGVNATGTNTGNVQNTGTRTFNQTGIFHYTSSSTPQSTGTAIGSNTQGKRIIIEKSSASNIVNLTQSTSTTDSLKIIQGTFVETATANVSGAGTLAMSGGTYQTAVTASTVPQLSVTYSLTGGTLELNAAGNQELRGSRAYNSLTFSNSGTKTITSGISSIAGTVSISGSAILDVTSNTFGGASTNFTMTGGRFRSSKLTNAQPEMDGTYSLSAGTVELYGTSASQQQTLRGGKTYFNVELNSSAANSGQSNVVQGAGNVTVLGTFTVATPTVYEIGGTSSIAGAGNFTLASGAGFKYGDANGIKTSGTGTSDGNIRVGGTRTFPTTASYGFVGSTTQVSGNGLPATVANLYVQKTNVSNIVTLSNDITLSDTLAIRNGVLNASARTLTFQNGNVPLKLVAGSLTLDETSNLIFGTTGNTAGAAVTIPNNIFTSAPSINNLTINRTNGVVFGNQNFTLNGTLTLTLGNLTVGNNTLALNGNPIAGAGAATNLITTSGSSLSFGGSTAGHFVPASVAALKDLTINNTSNVTLNGNLSIDGSIILINGELNALGRTLSFQNGDTPITRTAEGGKLITNASTNLTFGQESGAGAKYTFPEQDFIGDMNLGNLTINRKDSVLLNTKNWNINGTLTLSSGILKVIPGSTLSLYGATNQVSGKLAAGTNTTVNYAQTGSVQSVLAGRYYNLSFNNSGKVLPSSDTVFIANTLSPGTSGQTVTGSAINFNGTGSQTVPSIQYHHLVLSGNRGANNLTLPNGYLNIQGDFVNRCTFSGGSLVNTGTYVYFNGNASQAYRANAAYIYEFIYVYTNGDLNVHQDLGASTRLSIESGTLKLNAGITLNIGDDLFISSGSGTINSDDNATIIYSRFDSGQDISNAFEYGNLIFNDSKKVFGSRTISIKGHFNPGAATDHDYLGSTIRLIGSGAQNIYGSTYDKVEVAKSTGSLSVLGDTMKVEGLININGGTVNSNNKIKLVGFDNSIYGALLDNSTAANGSVVGDILVQRIVEARGGTATNGKAAFYSSPFSDAVYADYQATNRNFFIMNNGAWARPTITANIPTGIGFSRRGAKFGENLRIAGKPNSGDISPTLSTSAAGTVNTVGNPYPSTIDWDLVEKTNIDGGVAYAYNGSSFQVSGGTWDGKISIAQGFQIRATTGATLKFTNACRLETTASFLRVNEVVEKPKLSMHLYSLDEELMDESFVVLNEKATLEFSRALDAKKFWPTEAINPALGLVKGLDTAVICNLPSKLLSKSVPMITSVSDSGMHKLTIEGQEFFEGIYDFVIYDSKTGQSYVINDTTTRIYLNLNKKDRSRYYLNLKDASVPVVTEANDPNQLGHLQVYAFDKQLIVNNYTNQEILDIKVMSVDGKLFSEGLHSSISLLNATPGVYIVKVQLTSGFKTFKVVLN